MVVRCRRWAAATTCHRLRSDGAGARWHCGLPCQSQTLQASTSLLLLLHSVAGDVNTALRHSMALRVLASLAVLLLAAAVTEAALASLVLEHSLDGQSFTKAGEVVINQVVGLRACLC